MRAFFKKIILKFFRFFGIKLQGTIVKRIVVESEVSEKAKIHGDYTIRKSKIGDYTYISQNSHLSMTQIGKFCSIGPNLMSGWGIHPVSAVSTSPMFYSTMKQNGFSLVTQNKIEEQKPIIIGNDVFIGMNVIILDGLTIGDGAIIGAGSVVVKDVAPYEIVAGNPAKVIKKRFSDDIIDRLLVSKWWDKDLEGLKLIEKYFFEVETFLNEVEELGDI